MYLYVNGLLACIYLFTSVLISLAPAGIDELILAWPLLVDEPYLYTGPHTISPPVQTGPVPPVPLQTCEKNRSTTTDFYLFSKWKSNNPFRNDYL
jgi:hypothetical protein